MKIRLSNTWNNPVLSSSSPNLIIDPHNDLHPVALIAQLVEHCIGIAEVWVSSPVSPEIFRLFSLLRKVGIHVNLRGILRGLKKGLKKAKDAPNPRAAHQVGGGLFGCPYINF